MHVVIRPEDADEQIWLRYWRLGIEAQQRGDLVVAERLLRAGVLEAEALGGEDPRLASSLSLLGDVLRSQDRFPEAAPLYRRAVGIYTKSFGAGHPSTVEALQNLSAMREACGEYAAAEEIEKRLLALEEEALGDHAPQVASTLSRLATLCRLQGKLAESEQYYTCALSISEGALGGGHPDVGRTLSNLAGVRLAQGKASEAASLLRSALAILEAALGKDSPEVAQVTEALGAAIRATDPAWKGLFEGTPPSLPPSGLETSGERFVGDVDETEETVGVGGNVFDEVVREAHKAFDDGDLARAETKYSLALAILEKSGREGAEVAYCHLNLGRVLGAQGHGPDVIKPPVKAALKLAERLGEEHPVVASCCVTLATLATMEDDHTRAKTYLKRAIPILTSVHGKDHPKVGNALCDLAITFKQLGRLDESYAHFVRALAVLRKAASDADLLEALHGTAQTCVAQDKLDEAEGLYAETLELLEALYGPAHKELREPLREYAALLERLGRGEQAARLSARLEALAGESAGAG